MLVITRWRLVSLGQGTDLISIINEIRSMFRDDTAKKIEGHGETEIYFNEVGPEVVFVGSMRNFSVLSELDEDQTNIEFGLKLLKLGFVLHSVEYLREIETLSKLEEALRRI